MSAPPYAFFPDSVFSRDATFRHPFGACGSPLSLFRGFASAAKAIDPSGVARNPAEVLRTRSKRLAEIDLILDA